MIALNKIKHNILSENEYSISKGRNELHEELLAMFKRHYDNKESTECGLMGEYIEKDKLYKIKYRYRPFDRDTACTLEEYYILAEISQGGKTSKLHCMLIKDKSNSLYKKIIGIICCIFSLWMLLYAFSSGISGIVLIIFLCAILLCGVLLIVSKGDDRQDADELTKLFEEEIKSLNNSSKKINQKQNKEC
ncbi:MAG: hypothetical protein ACI4II_06100 [Acutalibacteraceae bacterium]